MLKPSVIKNPQLGFSQKLKYVYDSLEFSDTCLKLHFALEIAVASFFVLRLRQKNTAELASKF